MEPFPKPIKIVKRAYVFSDEQIEWLRRNFPLYGNPPIAEEMGICITVLKRLAQKYGLTKSAEGWKVINRTRGDSISKALRAANIRPGEECLNALRRKMASGWNPMQSLTPDEKKEIIQKRSETRKRNIRSERRRILFGFEPKGRIHLPQRNYTKNQYQCRSRAKKRGYILPADIREGSGNRFVIYYNEQTERSQSFENRLNKHGFRLVELNNNSVELKSNATELNKK